MSVCAIVAGVATVVAGSAFTLSWTHSVERTEWRERWVSTGAGLRLLEARVRGSGAGMDPGDGARLEGGWWVWEPSLPAQPALVLAASGATGGGWTLCALREGVDAGAGRCVELGRSAAAPTRLASCPAGNRQPPSGPRTGRRPGGGDRCCTDG